MPEPFLLSALVADRSAHPTMIGTIFRGHFERGGVAITASNVVARVKRVFYAGRLDPKAPPPTELRYLMFGSPAEPFLAHLITCPPDFDQILAAEIKASPPGLARRMGRRGHCFANGGPFARRSAEGK